MYPMGTLPVRKSFDLHAEGGTNHTTASTQAGLLRKSLFENNVFSPEVFDADKILIYQFKVRLISNR